MNKDSVAAWSISQNVFRIIFWCTGMAGIQDFLLPTSPQTAINGPQLSVCGPPVGVTGMVWHSALSSQIFSPAVIYFLFKINSALTFPPYIQVTVIIISKRKHGYIIQHFNQQMTCIVVLKRDFIQAGSKVVYETLAVTFFMLIFSSQNKKVFCFKAVFQTVLSILILSQTKHQCWNGKFSPTRLILSFHFFLFTF